MTVSTDVVVHGGKARATGYTQSLVLVQKNATTKHLCGGPTGLPVASSPKPEPPRT
jgi:hypothetical protein